MALATMASERWKERSVEKRRKSKKWKRKQEKRRESEAKHRHSTGTHGRFGWYGTGAVRCGTVVRWLYVRG